MRYFVLVFFSPFSIAITLRWIHAIGREFRTIPGLRTMYEVFRAFPGVLGEKGEHIHLFSGNIDKYFKGIKPILVNMEQGKFENYF